MLMAMLIGIDTSLIRSSTTIYINKGAEELKKKVFGKMKIIA